MTTYDTPGACIERADLAQAGISRLRTDVAAFVGIAERGPSHRAVAVESWKQFGAIFGGLIPSGYLAYVTKAFFENGGRRCWIVRVESAAAATASITLPDSGGPAVWRIEASSSGAWGNALRIRVLENRRSSQRALRASADGAEVASVAGFARGDTVELIQLQSSGVQRERRVLSAVDEVRRCLIWNHADVLNHIDAVLRLPSDRPLTVIDPSAPLRIEAVSYELQVFLHGRPWRVYRDLATAPVHQRYGPRVVNGVAALFAVDSARSRQGSSPLDTAGIIAFGRRTRTAAYPEPVRIVECREAPDGSAGVLAPIEQRAPLKGGFDGLASLAATDFIGIGGSADDSDRTLLSGRYGIAALEEIDEISLVAVPDIHIQPRILGFVPPPACEPDPCLPGAPAAAEPAPASSEERFPRFSSAEVERVLGALVDHCERRRDRVALLDAPFSAATGRRPGVAAVRDFRRRFDSTYAALYFPWLSVRDELVQGRTTLEVPPCGHVAGQIAATDLRVGVHKAPANVPMLMAEGATFAIDEATHGLLNSEGINAIRALPGRGLRIAGARLVSSDPDLRFLNVRRLLLFIERSIEASIQWAVFEGNDWMTRAKLTLSIGSFLTELWSRGALMGSQAEEAFYVRCDETNNPPGARDRGEMRIEIGIAPSVPFEFVVLRIGRSGDAFEFSESAREAF